MSEEMIDAIAFLFNNSLGLITVYALLTLPSWAHYIAYTHIFIWIMAIGFWVGRNKT